MSFDADAIRQAVARWGKVSRILVVETAGSVPREAGTWMLAWPGGQSGTIGGGTLEHDALRRARQHRSAGVPLIARVPLGPALGQCCGGSVTLATEVFDTAALAAPALSPDNRHRLVPLAEGANEPPLSIRRALAELRNGRQMPGPRLLDGWLIEPLAGPRRNLWIWGAGHVGRALVDTLAPLPDWRITWIDTAPERFPDAAGDKADVLVAADPARAVPHAPRDAHHLILTYSHALDLDLCHALLNRGFASAGLIGSTTKWQRFRRRLRDLGHAEAEILRIACPIGDPALGKHPQAIAVGVAAHLLRSGTAKVEKTMDRPA